jgi:dTDP-4-dehydrorhamnose 3,5-epimerase
MRLTRLAIADVVEIAPARHADDRGYFSETFRDDWFRRQVADVGFVQENQSLSRREGVVRGLHFQCDPFAQGKLVRCVAGAIFDVAVDIRHGSPSYGRWVAATLTAEEGNQLWVPAGFLHGFCTLGTDTVVAYKVTNYYDRASDKGVQWNDPEIAIDWPDLADPDQLSTKDRSQPRLRELPRYFDHTGEAR